MNPLTGGRFHLRLQGVESGEVRFQAEFLLPNECWDTCATVCASTGQVDWDEPRTEKVPPWLLKYATSALRSAWRAHGGEGWPRRLTRWRETPKARPQRRETNDAN